MLPEPYRQSYQTFQDELPQLQAAIEHESTVLVGQQMLANLQANQQQAIALPTDDLSAIAGQRLQALQIEINKQLRLLSTDLMFLQAAKQPQTRQQRQQQISERLHLLKQYCEAVLAIDP